MTDVVITPAETQADVAEVVTLCWAYRDFLMRLTPQDREITQAFYPEKKYSALMQNLATAHARPNGIILLARTAEGMPVGCGMSHALRTDVSEIKRVFVTEQARGQGIAQRLCTALLDQARADGFRRVMLDTSVSLIDAQKLYMRLGFQRRGPYQDIPAELLPHLVFYERVL